ncbi:hypothetical protein J4212_02095 [Candidatus Woesearchaeota archaeon]|nr:hypothetical protein [Candidatus Woesearchaeota archaeon]
MIVSIKKRRLPLILAIVCLSLLPLVFGQVLRGFGVELWITNNNPDAVLDTNRSSMTFDPSAGGTIRAFFIFNVTDTNGEDDVNEAGAYFNLTLGTANPQYRSNITCRNISKVPADNKVIFNCSVRLKYFDNASSNWVINFTVADNNGGTAKNDSRRFTYNTLSSLSFARSFINFSSLNLGQSNQQASAPLVLNNTGNDDFNQINISAATLFGVDVPSESIGSSSFTVNGTDNGAGNGMPLANGELTIRALTGNLSLNHGHTSANTDYYDTVLSPRGNQSLYFWVDVPSSGISSQKYNNTWNITVINLP